MSLSLLVTGATGAIGANLAKHLVEQSHSVVSILHDLKPMDSTKALGVFDKIIWAQGDVTNENLIKRIVADYDVREVYHLAALPIVQTGLRVYVPVYHTNILGTLAVLEAIREQNNAGYNVKMLYLSTDKVYGYEEPPSQETAQLRSRESARGLREENCLKGMAPYENSKACADLICQGYAKTFDLDVRIVRSCNVYGPADFNSRIFPNTIRRLLARKPALIWKGINYVREYMHVNDLVSAMELVMSRGKAGDIFNVGSGVLKTQECVIAEIARHFEHGEVQTVEPPSYTEYEIQYQALDHSRISKDLDWCPTTTFEGGVEQTVRWWRDYIKAGRPGNG